MGGGYTFFKNFREGMYPSLHTHRSNFHHSERIPPPHGSPPTPRLTPTHTPLHTHPGGDALNPASRSTSRQSHHDPHHDHDHSNIPYPGHLDSLPISKTTERPGQHSQNESMHREALVLLNFSHFEQIWFEHVRPRQSSGHHQELPSLLQVSLEMVFQPVFRQVFRQVCPRMSDPQKHQSQECV